MSSAPPVAKTNVLSIVGMVLSLFGLLNVISWGWFTFGFAGAFSIAGVICSHIAMKQIKERGEGGRQLALTGVITGWVGIGLTVLQFIIGIVGVILLAAASSASGSM
jgi:bacteriorhodopsin